MNIEIREFNKKDIPKIKTFLEKNRIFHVEIDEFGIEKNIEGYSEFEIQQILQWKKKLDGYIPVITKDGELAGVGFAYIKSNKESVRMKTAFKIGTISKLFVDDRFRGLGLGKMLIESMENYLKNNGCKYITLSVVVSNKHAFDMYKRRGYKNKSTILMKKVEHDGLN